MVEIVGYLPSNLSGKVQLYRQNFTNNDHVLELDIPKLTELQVRELVIQVRECARKNLRNFSTEIIVDIIDITISRLLDRKNIYRQNLERYLPQITGYDKEMVRLGLTDYLKLFRKPQLLKFLAEDFPNPKILDQLDISGLPKTGLKNFPNARMD